ncbi:hypothetical protein [Actinoplanes solisilvae]|uniref:hypothetical protein n=1 Tax=Actinoplanes solisilvae TaxID=2486853 RepID=UPI000FD6E363|nr:hypothetical protein [Actinoplanes solisilvae]
MIQPGADTRHRPIVLDTGELRPSIRRRGRTARRAFDVAVVTLLSVGAVAAGTWSILTAAQGNEPTQQPAPLWFPASTPSSAPSPTPSASR